MKKRLNIGETYRNDKACIMFIEAFADVERGKLQEKLDAAKFISVMSDGSTDVSAIENEVIYIQFSLQSRDHHGKVPCKPIGIGI